MKPAGPRNTAPPNTSDSRKQRLAQQPSIWPATPCSLKPPTAAGMKLWSSQVGWVGSLVARQVCLG